MLTAPGAPPAAFLKFAPGGKSSVCIFTGFAPQRSDDAVQLALQAHSFRAVRFGWCPWYHAPLEDGWCLSCRAMYTVVGDTLTKESPAYQMDRPYF